MLVHNRVTPPAFHLVSQKVPLHPWTERDPESMIQSVLHYTVIQSEFELGALEMEHSTHNTKQMILTIGSSYIP